MKKLILLMVISGAMSACSSKGGSGGSPAANSCSTLQGHYTWNQDANETLDIAGDCTFTDSVCGYAASYTVPAADGSTVITVSGTNGTPGCMSSTSHMCTLEMSGSQLAVECDGGAVLELYNKQ
jgi:hypothetical protein